MESTLVRDHLFLWQLGLFLVSGRRPFVQSTIVRWQEATDPESPKGGGQGGWRCSSSRTLLWQLRPLSLRVASPGSESSLSTFGRFLGRRLFLRLLSSSTGLATTLSTGPYSSATVVFTLEGDFNLDTSINCIFPDKDDELLFESRKDVVDFHAIELKTGRTDKADILACTSWPTERNVFEIALLGH